MLLITDNLRMNLALYSQSEMLRARLSAASALMNVEFQILSAESLEFYEPSERCWLLMDCSIEELLVWLPHLQARGVSTRRRVIRLIDAPWHSYVYHDLPLFASIVIPSDPVGVKDVLQRLEKTLGYSELAMQQRLHEEEDPFAEHLCVSPIMQTAVKRLRRVSACRIDLILYGPSGAGKDTSARWLHRQSGVKGDFVHVNCAAMPEQLFEAELFGVKAGAFTGALTDRPGKLELADKGTLYLDEIDSLPLSCQAKLLNALQYRGAVRLGGQEFIASQFRLIVSSKTDLRVLVDQGQFREDLYYRLNTAWVNLPPLNARCEDIIPIFRRCVLDACREHQCDPPSITLLVEDWLLSHDWRGNVRELRSFAVRFALGLADELEENPLQHGFAVPQDHRNRMAKIERALIAASLERCDGQVKDAAADLGIQLNTLYYRMKALEISAADLVGDPELAVSEHPKVKTEAKVSAGHPPGSRLPSTRASSTEQVSQGADKQKGKRATLHKVSGP